MLRGLAKPEDLVRLESIKPNLVQRSNIIRELRNSFFDRGFIETDTPTLIKAPAPEDYIDAPRSGACFLRSSPELHMKRLVAAGYEKIFQIGPCFRAREIGKLHNVEFTMLEWYETGKTYIDLIYFLKDLLLEIVTKTKGTSKIRFKDSKIDFAKEWKIFTVKEAFLKFAGTTPEEAIAKNEFEILLTEKVEPNLPKETPVILKDYPASMAALSKVNKNNNVAERWELYLDGIEIANAYSELTDYNEQKKRFEKAHKRRRENKLSAYPDDQDFFRCLEYGIKAFAGCALGVDRLVMVLTNAETIRNVNFFTELNRP